MSRSAAAAMKHPSVRMYVMRPLVVPPTRTPSYRSCASFIVALALSPSFVDAACCIVDVTKGAAGVRRTRFVLRLRKNSALRSSSATYSCAVVASGMLNFSSFSPRTCVRSALKVAPARSEATCASIVQYSCAQNSSISRSRSHTMRSATDCTLPAEAPRATLRQSSGESLNPTRKSSARRAKYASISSSESSRGRPRASCTASGVTSVKVMRCTSSACRSTRRARSTSSRCHEMASPSRSGSVASSSVCAPRSACWMSASTSWLRGASSTAQVIAKSASGCTDSSRVTRSRMWPYVASTVKSLPM
mmetsp:Transcript_2612/g.9470  ORF Transcript_2612/g.9470 Transcript_2612/m.9470 type:complete len:306 (-) Transcript_2612:296-1213(-)